MELKAYQAYRNPEIDSRYWRTSTEMEVDFILGEVDVALEIKGVRRVHEGDLKGLTALLTEQKVKHPLLISLEREPRKMGAKVRALPWEIFLRDRVDCRPIGNRRWDVVVILETRSPCRALCCR